MTTTNDYDKKIDELIKIAQEKKAAVLESEKIIEKAWLTNCSAPFPFNKENLIINIQTATIPALIDFVTSLINYQTSRNKACEFLGTEKDNKYHGFLFEDWINDCKKRINIISIKEKKSQLNNLEERLNTLISPERKRQLELEEIEKQLS